MNKGRWASILLVARRSMCSAVDFSVILVVLALERNNSTQFTPASKAGLLVEGTVRKNWTVCLDPRGLRPKAADKRLVLRGVGHLGRRKYKSHLAVRPVEVPRTLRDYSSGFPEFEGSLATAFIQCGWGSRGVQCHLIRSQTHQNGAARAFPKP